MQRYDICIIGAGMIGSAAAKYCSTLLNGKGRTLLIGPDEPNEKDYEQTDIFASYYDEGRIVKNLYSDPIWAYLSISSVKRYSKIEEESGIKFYTENGFLALLNGNDPTIEKISAIARTNQIDFEKLTNSKDIQKKFPYLNPAEDTIGFYESTNSGSINPRLLVKGQQVISQKHGCNIARDIVIELKECKNGFEVITINNGSFYVEKVILCVGAFLFHNNLIPKRIKTINVKCGLLSTARIPVDREIVKKLAGMPSITLSTNKLLQSFYMMPPIEYPDGVWYLKLGLHSHARKGLYGNPNQISDWYRNEQEKAADVTNHLSEIAQHFVQDLRVNPECVITDTCAITETPNDRPYIDEIARNLFIVTGCNGFSAKSSDEIGRIVANLATLNAWDCPFSINELKCRYVDRVEPAKLD